MHCSLLPNRGVLIAGNYRYDRDIDGRSIRVVTSADHPLLVITVYTIGFGS